MKKAFTLIELLIVIAIIGILAVTVLLALNPAEAQKKSRDTLRIKDATTLQAAFEQLIDSGLAIPSGVGEVGNAAGVTSTATTGAATNVGVKSQSCSSSWLGATLDVCAYIRTVPLDPANGADRTVVGQATAQRMYYRAVINGSGYEIGVRQESTANATKVTGDGGNNDDWFEVFSGPNTQL